MKLTGQDSSPRCLRIGIALSLFIVLNLVVTMFLVGRQATLAGNAIEPLSWILLVSAVVVLVVWYFGIRPGVSWNQHQQSLAAHVLHSLSDAVFVTSEEGKIRAANQAAERIFNMSPDQLLENSIAELLPELQLDALSKPIPTVPQEQAAPPLTLKRMLKAVRDRDLDLQVVVTITPTPLGMRNGFIIVVSDDSERERRRRMTQTLTEATSQTTGNEFFAAFVESLTQAFDADHACVSEILEHDPRRARVLALWSDGELLESHEYQLAGTPCAVSIDDGFCFCSANVAKQFPQDPFLTDKMIEGYFGVALVDSEGRKLGTVSVMSNRPLKERADDVIIFSVLAARASAEIERIRSIRELVEAKTEAERATESKSRFLANMSHEIRTPLTAILGFAENLSEEDLTTRERLEAVETIQRNGSHLLNVINDILDLSKIEADRIQLEKVECSPIAIVKEAVDAIRDQAVRKSLAVNTSFDSEIPTTIKTDPLRVRQILINLISNAVKFTETGHVDVHVKCTREPDGTRLIVRVIDTGIGMSDSAIQRLYQPFTQADSSTTRKFGGTGLGLTISKKLVEMLGGEIRVNSQLNAGTRFDVLIPVECRRSTVWHSVDDLNHARTPPAQTLKRPPQTTKTSQEGALTGFRVLLAEDGFDNQQLISFVLKKAGATVKIAENGQLAIEQFTKSREENRAYDVILMDMQMPVMDGYTATTKLREMGATLPIIAITAHAMSGDREKCLAAGCDDYLRKPIDRQKLISTIIEVANSHDSKINRSQPS